MANKMISWQLLSLTKHYSRKAVYEYFFPIKFLLVFLSNKLNKKEAIDFKLNKKKKAHIEPNYSNLDILLKDMISTSDEAWSYFLKHYSRFIYAFMNKIMPHNISQEDREDCFGEIIRVLMEDKYLRLKQIRSHDEKAFRSYLGVLTKRLTLNFVRRIKESYSLPDEILSVIPDVSIQPDIEILRSQIIDIINKKLTEQERIVISYFLYGLTEKEISMMMDLKAKTIFNIKVKAISKLKAAFKELK